MSQAITIGDKIMNEKKLPYLDLDLRNRKDEIWADIPFLDGAYEISNFGRVKALRRFVERAANGGFWKKEKILKLRLSSQLVSKGKRKLWRLQVLIRFEGRKYSVSIARMVYWLFIKRFDLEDRSQVVSFKDENPKNIRPENLILSSPSKNLLKAYQKSYRPIDSFENKARPINQYDLQGRRIRSHPSLTSAAHSTGISISNICRALNQGNRYSGGYIWAFGNKKQGKTKIPDYVIQKLESEKFHSTIISQYDKSGIKVKGYTNLKAAAMAVRAQTGQIRRAIIGPALSAKGYFWRLGKGGKRISLSHVEEKKQAWKKKICRPITQYDLRGKKIKNYPSVAEAARAIGVDPMNIHDALKDQGNRVGKGFVWLDGDGPENINISDRIKLSHGLT